VASVAVGPDPTLVYFRLIDFAGVHSFYSVPVAGDIPSWCCGSTIPRGGGSRHLLG